MTEKESLIYRALGQLDILAEYADSETNTLIINIIDLLEKAIGERE